MATTNLPAKENSLFVMLQDPALKKQMQLAIPKHMTVDRLLRVAMTAIRTTPKLMECTPKSLMACIMACAQLGLEPEPFLGQAYFVPFKVNAGSRENPRWELQATFIPGYRGYIAMARRSGEVQSVTAQAVYANDQFRVQYGLTEELYHIPTDEKRGEFRGAYVIFRYKDGSHSFDWMPKDRIDKVRERSKAKDSGPWVTDYDEMAVKTVIRHHVKLVPLSVELAKAAHLEERAIIGEDQASLIFGDEERPESIEGEQVETEEDKRPNETIPEKFTRLANESGIDDVINLKKFISASAAGAKKTEIEMMTLACADFPSFRKIYEKAMLKKQEKQQKEREKDEIAAKIQAAEEAKKKKDQANAVEKAGPRGTELRAEPEHPGPFPEEAEQVNKETGEVFMGPEVQDNRPDRTFIVCSARQGDKMSLGFCRSNCPSFIDCEECKPKS